MDTSHSPQPRALGWAVFGPLLVAVAAIVARYCGPSPGTCYDVAWTAAALSATVGPFAAWRRAHGPNRTRWGLWTAAAASWLVGQLVWDLFGITGFPGSPNPADIGWWLFAVLVLVSVLRFRGTERSIRAVTIAESLPLVCAAISVCLALLYRSYVTSAEMNPTRISDLVYPCLYASATILTFQAMLGGALRGLRRASVGLFLAGTATVSLAFMLWSGQLLAGTYVPGRSALDPLWVAGLALIGAGGFVAARHPEAPPAAAEPGSLSVLLPAGMFVLLVGALGLEWAFGGPHRADEILVLGLLCSGVALIVRSSLLSQRLRDLLGRERAAAGVLAEREASLARLNAQLTADSRHDPLTGIRNRRALADDLPMYKTLQREAGETLAVLLCDVDHFKAFNDRFGHLAGDQALCMIAATARGTLGPSDAAYRFGGEELLLILRVPGPEAAHTLAERIRRAVENAAVSHPASEHGCLTVSIGVACGTAAPEELLAAADTALYIAKETGRNRVVLGREGAATGGAPGRHRPVAGDQPAPRHLRSMLEISRAAAAGDGVMPVLEALADAIHHELSFNVVAVNLRELPEQFRAVVVLGEPSAREVLLDTTSPLHEWEDLLRSGRGIHGARWLPAGSYDHSDESPTWRSTSVAPLTSDGWDPEDMLLLPLRNAAREILGVVSVDQPAHGHRPGVQEIAILMAVVDHAGLALEQVQHHDASNSEESEALRLAAVMLLAEALDLRDASTARHSRTVGQLARQTATELGHSDTQVERIYAAGVLHDLGKLSISDAILHKPVALDEMEWREMRRHPEVGARILEHAGMHDIAAWVRAHHERVDGRGYPMGLSGPAISVEARILSVADAYEAMIADRPYRPGMPPAAARAELLRSVGSQFDPDVVAAFLRALDLAAHGDPRGPDPSLSKV